MGIVQIKTDIPVKRLVWSFLFFTLIGNAQMTETDKTTLEKTVATFYQAMIDKNESALDILTLPELSYGHSSGTIENKTQFMKAVLKGPFEFLQVATEDQTIALSDGVGIVRHILQADGSNAGEATDVRIGVMMLFKKDKNNWKLLARQAYKL